MSSTSLSPISDLNLKIFDEICEERFKDIDIEAVLVSIIDNVPSDALPHLAEQYHITGNEGWLQTNTEQEKRNLIKSAIKMHRYKGSKYVILETLKTLNIKGSVIEWFEYDGQPFFFKVLLEIFDRPISKDTENNLRDLIQEYKNERSWLESIQMHLATISNQKCFSAPVFEETLIIKPKEQV